MAAGFDIIIDNIRISTSEELYQACRFPYSVEVQKLIIEQKSPMTAKMKSKPFRSQTRHDWEKVKVTIMRWCLRVKLACNWVKFRELLLATGDKPIVEDSHRDRFWGAVAQDNETLSGVNAIGRLLMELREELKSDRAKDLKIVPPPKVKDFLLLGSPIPIIQVEEETVSFDKGKQMQLPF